MMRDRDLLRASKVENAFCDLTISILVGHSAANFCSPCADGSVRAAVDQFKPFVCIWANVSPGAKAEAFATVFACSIQKFDTTLSAPEREYLFITVLPSISTRTLSIIWCELKRPGWRCKRLLPAKIDL
jgi:hypothetical protein